MVKNSISRFFLPRTELGLLSIIFILFFFFLLVIMMLIVKVQGPMENQTFFNNLWLSIPGFLMVIFGIASFVTGLISIIKKKEKTFFVYLSTVMGLLILWFLIGEIANPH